MFGIGSEFVYHIMQSYKKACEDIDIDLNDELNINKELFSKNESNNKKLNS